MPLWALKANDMKKQLTDFNKKNGELIPIYIIMLVMIGINVWKQPSFFTLSTLTRTCNQLAPYVFISMAQMCVMVLGGMDFALGPLVSLSTCFFATMICENNVANAGIIIGVLLLVGIIHGVVGFIIGHFNLPTIVVTLATSFVFEGASLAVLPTAGGFMEKNLCKFFTGRIWVFPTAFLVCVLFIVIWYLFRKSSMGLLVYAVGQNKKAAFSSGLNVTKGYTLAFFLSGILAAMAGLMLSVRTMSGDPLIANDMTINSVTAAVLGGVTFNGGEGKMAGTIAGAIVVGILVNVLFYLNITGFYTYFVQGIILIIAVVVNSFRKRNK